MGTRSNTLETAIDAPAASGRTRTVPPAVLEQAVSTHGVPMLRNYLLCALAGTTWYFQFFFYTWAKPRWDSINFQLDPAHGQHHYL